MPATPYDGLYKLLFSHPPMVEALLRGFVHEDWVAYVDFATLEKPNGQYVSEELLQRSDDILWRVRWSPRFRHHLLDQGRVPAEELRRLSDNLMARLIELETHLPDDPLIREVTRALAEHLKGPVFDSLRRAFVVFYNRTIVSKLDASQSIEAPNDLQEIDTMLAERIDQWLDDIRRKEALKGRLEGRREGEQEGLLKGKQVEAVRMLSRLLRLRFGDLPTWAEERLARAPLEQLEGWIDAVLAAETLEGVIGPEG